MVKCSDCDIMVALGNENMELHRQEFHGLRICDQCQVSIEAFKLPEHKVIFHSGPENLKKSSPKKLVKSNKSISQKIFLAKFHFLPFQK